MRNLIITIFAGAILAPNLALAGLEVQFESTPLFAEADILPGDAVGREVTVRNTGTEAEEVEFVFEDVLSGTLADVVELAVSDSGTVYVFDTFSNLFSGGPYSLGSIDPGEENIFTFYAAFPVEVGNKQQNEWFGFDIRIGFTDGQQVTDGGGSGGGSGTQTLQLFNEIATPEGGIGGAFITWNSNRRASTYLICGNLENGPFTLTEDSPLFGYEFSLDEENLDTTTHGFALSDLEPGDYECRPAGREDSEDGFTVGDPVQFTVGLPGRVAGDSISLTEADIQELLAGLIASQPQGSVLGVSSKGAGDLTYDEFRAEIDARQQKEILVSATENKVVKSVDSPENIADSQGSASYDATETGQESSKTWIILAIIVLVAAIILFLIFNSRSKNY